MDSRILLIFLFGFVGGVCAFLIGAPMPFMLGGILGAACFVLYYERDGRQLPKLSRWVRLVFMSIIGTMIGSRFSPERLSLLPRFWISGLTIIPFILLAHGGSGHVQLCGRAALLVVLRLQGDTGKEKKPFVVDGRACDLRWRNR